MVNMSTGHTGAPRLTITNASSSQSSPSHLSMTLTIPSTRSTIDEFLEITRGQSSDNSTLDTHSMDVPVKIYSPLPDIRQSDVANGTYPLIRTETNLTIEKTHAPKKNKMIHHFGSTQRGHLPTLNKSSVSSTITNVMDLDEDLPEFVTSINHRIATYTSPGARIKSPIERPAAPSPPASAQVKKSHQMIFAYDEHLSANDDDGSRFDEESFIDHSITNIPMQRRIDHYSHQHYYHHQQQQHHHRPTNPLDRQPTIIIDRDDDDDDDWAHPIDSHDYGP